MDAWADVYLTWNRVTVIDPDDLPSGSRLLAHSGRLLPSAHKQPLYEPCLITSAVLSTQLRGNLSAFDSIMFMCYSNWLLCRLGF